MASISETPLLDQVEFPSDIRSMDGGQLRRLADEIRHDLIGSVSRTGGHLGAGLGVVELTVALHHVFDTPNDTLIWDVGHQAYPHKILTGRRSRMGTIRQGAGLSGFTKRTESVYDPFGAGHSSTSISAGLGFAVARDLAGGTENVVCVIGDGAMSAGLAYEAMNNAGALKSRLIVILNDNEMSIAPATGALSAHLGRLAAGRTGGPARDGDAAAPERLCDQVRHARTGGSLFEHMGFDYLGPIDGHDLDHLVPVLRAVRERGQGPVLVHVVTQKGKGYAPAEASADKYHGVVKFDVATGVQAKPKAAAPAFTKVFADALAREAQRDKRVIAITAAMPSGTGLESFARLYPDRCFDVGIAEQHAVTFAAGLAARGMRPFCAIYSTFLQRAYDQIVHDVAIQNLPVRFAIDRAGLVGADGPTHAGSFDIAYLGCLPNFVIMAPSDEVELVHAVATAAAHDSGPIAFRYPRGEGIGADLPQFGTPFEIGKGRILREGGDVALLSLGARLGEAMAAADTIEAVGLTTTVADARFAKPLDREMLHDLARNHEVLVTIEEGASGGFGAMVLKELCDSGLLDRGLKVRTMTLPDRFIEHASPQAMYAEAGLDADGIAKTVFAAIGVCPRSDAPHRPTLVYERDPRLSATRAFGLGKQDERQFSLGG